MKKNLLFYLLCCSELLFATTKPTAARVLEFVQSGKTLTPVSLFDESPIRNEDALKIVPEGQFLRLNQSILAEAITQHPEGISIALPFRGERIVVDLIQAQVHTADFSVINQEYKGQTYQQGLHFRGMIHGNPNSMAAFSFYDNEVMGLMADDAHGNIVLGRLATNGNLQEYVLYEDKKMTVKMPFSCATADEGADNVQVTTPSSGNRSAVNGCVRIYFEGDYALYQNKGSLQATVNYLSGLFNQMAMLYANENVSVQFSQCMIWMIQDNYPTSSSSSALNAFYYLRGTRFNADLGHLIALGGYNLGGIAAALNVLCSSSKRAYSNIVGTYSNIPVFSWDVEVITHETGHNLGSNHTHWCGWVGGAIDNCYATEGGCALGPPVVSGGTIMSYCHLSSFINFNSGFGPKPGQKIRDRVTAASTNCLAATCLPNSCQSPIDISVVDIGVDSAKVAWTEIPNAISYTVSYRKVGASSWNVINNATSPYIFRNLAIAANHEVIIQSTCASGNSTTSNGLIFTTALDCSPISNWAGEDFEAVGFSSISPLPSCWAVAVATNVIATVNIPTLCFGQRLSISKGGVTVALPAMSDIATITKRLIFKAATSAYVFEGLDVGYMTDATDFYSFVSLKSFTITPSGSCVFNEYYANIGVLPSSASIAFRHNGKTPNSPIYIDDVKLIDAPQIDIAINKLLAPMGSADCYSNAEILSVRVSNEGVSSLDFAIKPLTVTINVTGVITTTFTKVVNTGTLAVGANLDISMANTLDMSIGGMYVFNCSAAITGDNYLVNNSLKFEKKVNFSLVSYPHFNNFTGYGPEIYYLSGQAEPYLASATNGWLEAESIYGKYEFKEVKMFGAFYGYAQNTAATFDNEDEYLPGKSLHLISPRIPLGAAPFLEFDVAVTQEYNTMPVTGTVGLTDSITIKISLDCAKTWTTIYVFDQTKINTLTNVFQRISINLSAYANQTVMFNIAGKTIPPISIEYFFHIDNIEISDKCANKPTAGVISGVSPVCPNRPFLLTLLGSSASTQLLYQWQSSDGIQPFSSINGANAKDFISSGQIVATAYRCIMICPYTNLRDTTDVFWVMMAPSSFCYCVPSSSASCALQTRFEQISILTTASGIPWVFYPTCNMLAYNNYITLGNPRTSLNRNIPINLDVKLTYPNEKIKVWIDANDDGYFDNATEQIGYGQLVGYQSVISLFIPTSVPLGNHQIRFRSFIAGTTATNSLPCNTFSYSETNDFTIQVVDNCTTAISTNLNVGTNSLPITCQESNFTYYGKDSTFHFAIDWNGNTTARDSALVSVGLLASNPIFAGTYGASKVMKRYWSVNLKGQVLTNPVKVRFYYDNAEFADIQSFSSNEKWFTVNSGVFNPLDVNNYNALNGALNPANTTNQTANVTYGTTNNGVAYAEMANLTNLTGGTFASDTLALAVRAKVFLNNLIISNQLMYNDLAATSPNFPLSDPYKIAPLNTTFIHVNNPTTASTTTTVVNAAQGNAIVDWVFVELRTGVSGSTTVVATKAGLLQRDGDIVNMDGVSPLHFNVAAGNYFVAIRHRNNLGFRTDTTVFLNANSPLLNFTNNSVPLYGITPVVGIPNTAFFVMNAGDANHDGSLDSVDSAIWEAQNGNFDDYFLNADYNLDSSIDGIDSAIWETNNGKYEELD